jgi:hypothetical protein
VPIMRDIYLKKCSDIGTTPDIEKFKSVERYLTALVRVCVEEGKATHESCPIAVVRIDDTLYYMIKIITPNVHTNILTREDLEIMGYGDYIVDSIHDVM